MSVNPDNISKNYDNINNKSKSPSKKELTSSKSSKIHLKDKENITNPESFAKTIEIQAKMQEQNPPLVRSDSKKDFNAAARPLSGSSGENKHSVIRQLSQKAHISPLSEPASDTSLESKASPENIDHFALELGWGYKAANLQIMTEHTNRINQKLKVAQVQVPPFFPVSHHEIFDYIQQKDPEIFKLWQDFKASFEMDNTEAYLTAASNEAASQTGFKITPEGTKILLQIRTRIEDLFNNKNIPLPHLEPWLKEVNPLYLIVRSTGKEDSDTNSNAGGNASILYVKPKPHEISVAIGEVIASYFGEKSINQRILCGDRSLLVDEQPFIPVLIQEMIFENTKLSQSDSLEIPRSGVIFTRQTDKAEGVVFIQTGLGLNEGIVSSLVPVDSYYIKDTQIHSVISKKDTRIIGHEDADGNVTTSSVENNNSELENNPALSQNLLLDLKTIADEISNIYGQKEGRFKAMDMEYTVKLKPQKSGKPVIYLLQARPLLETQGDHVITPTYLDLKSLQELPKENITSSEVLLDGNAHVRTISIPKHILFAHDLPTAETIYSTKSIAQVIIIQKTAPTTSHPAVILRPKGVPVLVVEDKDKFQALKKSINTLSQENSLLVDTQRGLIISGNKADSTEKYIRQGLISYSIPLQFTVPSSSLIDAYIKYETTEGGLEKIRTELNKFNAQTKSTIDNLSKGAPFLNLSIRELLDGIASYEEDQALLALASLLQIMKKRLIQSMHGTESMRASINQPMFQVFEAAIKLAESDLAPAIKQYGPGTKERLYPLKFLEAMIYQRANPRLVDAHSFLEVLQLDQAQKKAMDAAKTHEVSFKGKHALILLGLQNRLALTFNLKSKQNWQELIVELDKIDNSPQANAIFKRFVSLLLKIQDLGMQSIWLNTDFSHAWDNTANLVGMQRFEKFLDSLEGQLRENHQTLHWITQHRKEIDSLEEGIKRWQEPKYVKDNTQKLMLKFQKELGFDPSTLIKYYNQGNTLGKLALLQYVQKAVNVYDGIVKEVKGSTAFENDLKLCEAVWNLLQGYCNMMAATVKLLISELNEEEKTKLFGGHHTVPINFETYLEKLKKGHTYEFFDLKMKSIGLDNMINELPHDPKPSLQLEPREKFNVNSMVIGSNADLGYSVIWPDRLEEYFTLFHQNMEQVVKFLNTKNGLGSHLLSGTPQKLAEEIHKGFNLKDLSSFTETAGKLNVGYQIPLRSHSASIEMEQDLISRDTTTLSFSLFGANENLRWDQAAALVSLMVYRLGSNGKKMTMSPPQIKYNAPDGVKITIAIQKNIKTSELKDLIGALKYVSKFLSMGSMGSSEHCENMILYGPKDSRVTEIENAWKADTSFFGSNISWKDIDPTCYQYTLGVNRSLMYYLEKEKWDIASAARVAVYSIKGMALYRLDDYLPATNPTSLLNDAVNCLEKNISHSKVREEIRVLLEDPDVQSRFPEIVDNLRELRDAEALKEPERMSQTQLNDKDEDQLFLNELLISDEEDSGRADSDSEKNQLVGVHNSDDDLLISDDEGAAKGPYSNLDILSKLKWLEEQEDIDEDQ